MQASHVWRVLSEAPKLILWFRYQAPRRAGTRCRHHFAFFILAGSILLLLPSALFAQPPEYRVVPIPAQLYWGRLNDSSVVAATTWTYTAWMWNRGLITDLPGPNSENRYANDINNSSIIVGVVGGFSFFEFACMWQNGILSYLNDPDFVLGWVYGINSVSTIIGDAWDTTTNPWSVYPFIYTGSMAVLDGLENYSFHAINDGGVIAGTSWSGDLSQEPGRAFLYYNGTVTFLSDPGSSVQAYAINNSNHVLGEVGGVGCCLWKDGTQVFLGSLLRGGSRGGLNDHDAVVGYAWNLGAVIWENGEVRRLDALIDPNLGLHFWNGCDINNKGEILCMGSDSLAYLLIPIRAITVRDANNDTIPNVEFSLITVANDAPFFTEDTLGFFTTDSVGQLELTELVADTFEVNLSTGTKRLVNGDSLKIAKHVQSVPAVRHGGVLGTMYSVHLDNAQFDKDGSMSFGTLKNGRLEAVLNHTELRYNLLVSVEWDAAEEYLQGLQADFPAISNYLYDVSDGQVRLDTVAIVDDGELWDMADIRIRASNCHNPNAATGGINLAGRYPITMPRKWFGDSASSRFESYEQHPLGVSLSNDWHAKAHEFGHFALGFFDEYLFVDGGGHPLPATARCEPLPTGNYGFMDFPYDLPKGGVRSSEMSSQYRYQNPSCLKTNTEQWVLNGSMSCWDYFESWAESTFSGLYVPIRKPDQGDTTEHLTPTGLDYIRGPNDNLILPDYDVGGLVYFASTIMPPDPANRSLNLHVDSVPAGGCEVTLEKPLSAGGFRYLDQGKTRNDGLIWVLGASGPDHLQTYGHNYTVLNPAKGTAFAGISRRWLTASLDLSTVVGDSVNMTLQPIEGDYPMVLLTDISQDPQQWRLEYAQPFSQLPSLGFLSQAGQPMSMSVAELDSGYDAYPAGSIASEGQAKLESVDGAGQSFFVPFSYVVYTIDNSAQLSKLLGPNAAAILSLSSDNSTVAKALIAASSYPPILTGLETDAVQAGDAYSTSVSPSVTLTGTNNLTILYTDDDLKAGNSLIGDESLLQIYRWDEGGNSWQLVGGIVDTVRNDVTASITELGTYAAFTTSSGIEFDCGDADSDGMITIADAVFLVEYIFVHGAAPSPLAAGDADCSGDINIADAVYLIGYIFSHGLQPCAACK